MESNADNVRFIMRTPPFAVQNPGKNKNSKISRFSGQASGGHPLPRQQRKV